MRIKMGIKMRIDLFADFSSAHYHRIHRIHGLSQSQTASHFQFTDKEPVEHPIDKENVERPADRD